MLFKKVQSLFLRGQGVQGVSRRFQGAFQRVLQGLFGGISDGFMGFRSGSLSIQNVFKEISRIFQSGYKTLGDVSRCFRGFQKATECFHGV